MLEANGKMPPCHPHSMRNNVQEKTKIASYSSRMSLIIRGIKASHDQAALSIRNRLLRPNRTCQD